MSKYKFPCGCEFDVIDETPKACDGLPGLAIDYYNIPNDCPATWALIQTGRTKGIFQLENNLGKKWAKQLAPSNITEMSALISLFRPGCISGNTQILTNFWNHHIKRYAYKYMTIKELYEKRNTTKQIVSFNEQSGKLFRNNIEQIIYTGIKPVYRIKLNKSKRPEFETIHTRHYNLMCTKDHKLFTPKGWIEVQNMDIDDKFAVLKYTSPKRKLKNAPGQKNFRDICFKHYDYHCVFCDWMGGSLDVNHLEGNRTTNNDPSNLCFMCPNHHRMYSEGNITKEKTIQSRKQYTLPQYEDIMWASFKGIEFLGEQEVYDISMEGPYHNFIAGKTIVHNCLKAVVDGKSMTEHYCDRKNCGAEVKYFHDALEPILQETYGVLTYQEQSMKIAQSLAGFTLQEADVLRKAIGKKKADIMAKVKTMFIEGCKKVGKVTEEQAEEIFGWIQESQRYSFNKSHGVGYGQIGYWSAYVKAHFPIHFFTAWLYYANEKMKPQVEVRNLVSDTKYFDIQVKPPSLTKLYNGDVGHFAMDGKSINFGIGDIKKIGESHVSKVIASVETVETALGRKVNEWTWYDFLIFFSDTVSQTVINGLVAAGATDYMGGNRSQKVHEYAEWRKLTQKEREWVRENSTHCKTLLDATIHLLDVRTKNSAPRKIKIAEIIKVLSNPTFSTEDDAYFITSQETELLGVRLTCSKLDTCTNTITADTTCKEFLQGKSGNLSICVEITAIKEGIIKKGSSKGAKMYYLTVEDETDTIDSVVAFPKAIEGNESIILEGNTVIITGKRDKKNTDSFILDSIIQI